MCLDSNGQKVATDTLQIYRTGTSKPNDHHKSSKMKLFAAPLLLVFSAVHAAAEGLTYSPNNDVTTHSKIALDQLDIVELIQAGDVAGALDIYQNGLNREGKSLQAMARKDWVAAELDAVSEYDAYAALFNQGDGEPFLDSYTLDAMHCNGTFAGQNEAMCAIAAQKNLLCTGLLYAQYEGVQAIQFSNEKNWDELFAFWNGVYDEAVDTRVNAGGPGSIQTKRDADYGTTFHEDSIKAIIAGQAAFSGGSVNTAKLTSAYEAFKKANLATFVQATLKYSSLFDAADLDQAQIDKKWGEGYTYFRCGAGLMDPELALYINYVFDPRDKMGMTLTAKETHCKIVTKMLSLPEIGMGLTLGDLNVQSIKEDCGIPNFTHAEGTYSKGSESERAYLPVIGLFVVIGMYVGGYYVVTRKAQP